MVLDSVGLQSSTYYHAIQDSRATAETGAAKNSGRKIPGYSYNSKNERVYDAVIKENILEIIGSDGFAYGYKKINEELKDEYDLIINHKKTYRLCKELDVLRPQRKVYPLRPRTLAKKDEVSAPNQLWQMDIKYGYIHEMDRFFFQLSVIDVFDRTVIDYHIGLSAKAKDACAVLANAIKKRCYDSKTMPVIRTDNGTQFTSKAFAKECERLGLSHERIPVKTPSMNAYIESFHSILEDECYSRNEFSSFAEVYRIVSDYMDFYNNRRRHGSIGYMAPAKYYKAVMNNAISGNKLVA